MTVTAVPAHFVQDIKAGDLFQDGSKVVKVIHVGSRSIHFEDGTRIARQVPVS